MLLVLFVAVLAAVYYYFTKNFDYWRKKKKKSIGTFLSDLYKKTDFPCYGFYIFNRRFLLARDPDLIKRILMNDFDYFDDRTVAVNMKHDKLSSLSLLMLKNPEWKIFRSRFSSTLAIGKMKNMIPIIVKASEDFVAYLKKSNAEVTECRELSIKYSLDVLASWAFGLSPKSFEESDFYKMASNLQNSTPSRAIQSAC
ncbi:hypothetical protein FQR65_LT15936 [Abscondita terminalis]|nr:hypothetical protein FQR65_LT15936 [Abscondita terminalis]